MATKKTTIVAEIKADTGEAQKQVEDLKDGIEGVGEATAKSIKELKELKIKLKEATVGSEEFKKLKQTIDDTEEAINAAKVGAGNFADIMSDLPGPIGEVGGKISGLTGGLKQFSQVKFTDIKSSFKELFNDIKDIGANIAKMTGLTKVYEIANNAASKSLQFFGVSAQGATAASKAFGVAISGLLAATGLILLTATIQAVSEAWEYYSTSAERAEESQKKLNDSLLKGAQVALDAESKSTKRRGDLLLAQAKERGANADEIYKIEVSNRKLLLESQERYYNELKNKDSDEARSALSAIKDTKNEILVAEFNFQDQKNKLIREKEKTAAAERKAEQQKRDAEEKARLEKAEADAQAYEDFDTALQQRLIEIEDEKIEKAKKTTEQLLESQQLFNKFYNDQLVKIKELEQAREDTTFATNIAIQQSWFNLGTSIANTIGNLSGALKDGSDLAKAFGIAQVAISTAASIGSILLSGKQQQAEYNKAIAAGNATIGIGIANSFIPGFQGLAAAQILSGKAAVGSAIAGKAISKTNTAAQVIAAGIAGAAQIAAIVASKKASSSGSISGGGDSNNNVSISPSAPLMPSASTTTLNQAQVNQMGNMAARAYVVESDISGNQERITRLNRAARIS